jgi:hypothetical protein
LRRGNLDVLDILDYEFASLRSQRQQKDFFSGLLEGRSQCNHVRRKN